MKNITTLLFLVGSMLLYAQQTPTVTLSDDTQLQLSSLEIQTTITGNYAQTFYYMTFYNSLSQVMEGELSFPLGEGQSVSGFAMEVNGEMRKAVIVEKELARVAYENTIQQKIDPALLEKVDGNNYKARIYPIPAKGYKEVVLAYEQELYTLEGKKVFELPLGIQETLKHFKLSIDVFGAKSTPIPVLQPNTYKGLGFTKKNRQYSVNFDKNNFKPFAPIVVQIPTERMTPEVQTAGHYFLINKTFEKQDRVKEKPNSLTLLLDASFSQQYRNTKAEFALLDDYFKYLGNVTVQLVVFSNDLHFQKNISVIQGDWKLLKQEIEAIEYDGGTNYRTLEKVPIQGKEVLLFSDGLVNLGDFTWGTNKPIYTINSKSSANHEKLQSIASASGGNYINLVRMPVPDAARLLQMEPFQYLGIQDTSALEEVYPIGPTTLGNDFSIAGIFNRVGTITLQFGYGGNVTETLLVTLDSPVVNPQVERLWALAKLKHLNRDKKQHKDAIISLSKAHELITDYTSLLILDRVEDYARYKIEPPKELRREYKRLVSAYEKTEALRKKILEDRKAAIEKECNDLVTWSKKTFNTKKIVSKNKGNERTGTLDRNSQNPNFIYGTVRDEMNVPIPGVNIIVKGTNRGTQSDFDGNFSIEATAEDLLEFSYLSYESTVRRGGDIHNRILEMHPSSSQLEEVVITGFSRRRESSSVGYSVSSVQQEAIEENTTIDNLLEGKAAGTNITSAQGLVGNGNTVVIRGMSSMTSTNNPLYIVDGVLVRNVNTLDAETIESISVLKEDAAIALYGTEGKGGVILITTKEGGVTNEQRIRELDEKIKDKIELKAWDPNAHYIDELKAAKSLEEAYARYIKMRKHYSNLPTFYLDVSDFFWNKGEKKLALRVVTNLLEINIDDYELLMALAYKLESFQEKELVVFVYEKLLELRPENPQSYRNLALAYEAVEQYQKSYELLYDIYNGSYLKKDENQRFYGIEQIAYTELCRLVHIHGDALLLSEEDRSQFKKLDMDIRVVINWNHNNTDIDLWVTDSIYEKAFYGNKYTNTGGRMSDDMTDGFGPEEYMIKKALNGSYTIEVNYFGDSKQSISGPTILKTTIYTNYGRPNEEKKVIIHRLENERGVIEIGTVSMN